MDPESLADEEVVRRLKTLAAEERASMKTFVILLREFDRRKLAGATQHGTTFRYCTDELRLSEGETFRRLQVAGVIGRHGALLDMIEDGRLSLTTASLLAPYLNQANFSALTSESAGKGRRAVEEVVARYRQRPEARDIVAWMGRCAKAAPAGPSEDALLALPEAAPTASAPAPQPDAPPAPQSDAPPAPQSDAPPVSPPDPPAESQEAPFARLHFDVPNDVVAKLEKARALLRHRHPDGKLADILDEALDALLDRLDRSRKEKPAAPRPVLPGRRRIPEWVKDEVWRRDAGRCAFETVDGKRCEASEWLEFDHVTPYALGGVSDDPDNVRLLCRAHNQHRAREDFGDAAWTGGTFEPGAAKPGAEAGAGEDAPASEPELPLGDDPRAR